MFDLRTLVLLDSAGLIAFALVLATFWAADRGRCSVRAFALALGSIGVGFGLLAARALLG